MKQLDLGLGLTLLILVVILLLLFEQLLREGVVILRLHIVGVECQGTAIATQSILQLLLHKLRISQVIVGIGTVGIVSQRVGRSLLQQTLGLCYISCRHLRLGRLRILMCQRIGHGTPQQRIAQIVSCLKCC